MHTVKGMIPGKWKAAPLSPGTASLIMSVTAWCDEKRRYIYYTAKYLHPLHYDLYNYYITDSLILFIFSARLIVSWAFFHSVREGIFKTQTNKSQSMEVYVNEIKQKQHLYQHHSWHSTGVYLYTLRRSHQIRDPDSNTIQYRLYLPPDTCSIAGVKEKFAD